MPGLGGGGGAELLFNGTGFQLGRTESFWRWTVVMVAQQCTCRWILHLKMLKMVNFLLCAFYQYK